MSSSQSHEPDGRRHRRREWARGVDLSTVGLVFPIAALIGVFAGRAVGSWFSQPGWGMAIGGAFGVAAGFYNLVKVALELQRREEQEEGEQGEASERGRDG